MTFDKTIVIVEGKSDTRRLKEIFPNIITFETSGLGLDNNKINQLKKYEKVGYNFICFTDPDGPGEVIRKKINEHFTVRNAFVAREHSRGKRGKIGVESATVEEIKKALANLKTPTESKYHYELDFLIENDIYGNSKRREIFCNLLVIANGNNKKVLNQLNNFSIPFEKANEVIKKMENDENSKSNN